MISYCIYARKHGEDKGDLLVYFSSEASALGMARELAKTGNYSRLIILQEIPSEFSW